MNDQPNHPVESETVACSGGAAIDHDETGICNHGITAEEATANATANTATVGITAGEQRAADVFTEAAVSRSALLAGADVVENLPQDYECDPGRGDAVKALRRLADHYTTNEQPTGLTWEARTEHAVRLYATTAIERDDARTEAAKLREQLADQAREFAGQITTLGKARGWSTWAAEFIHPDREFVDPGKDDDQAAAEQRDNLDFNRGDTVAAVRDALLDPNEHTPETALAAARVLLAAHTRHLAAEARERLAVQSTEMRADGYRGRVAWCSGMREVAKLLDTRANTVAETGR